MVSCKRDYEKLQSERDEMNSKVQQLSHRHVQFQHEIRKKEHDYVKLQERLNMILGDRERGSRSGIDIVNTLQRQAARATWQRGAKSV